VELLVSHQVFVKHKLSGNELQTSSKWILLGVIKYSHYDREELIELGKKIEPKGTEQKLIND
jgi:hypothetical protein